MSSNLQIDEPQDPFDPATDMHADADLDLQEVDIEVRYRWAMAAVQGGRRGLSARKAAVLYRLPRTTLDARLLGVKSRQEAHEHEWVLGSAQEAVLVEWVKVATCFLIPPHSKVKHQIQDNGEARSSTLFGNYRELCR